MAAGFKLSGKEHTDAYSWGTSCSAWVLQWSGNVIIKEDLMPANTRGYLYYHHQLVQFFYILEGGVLPY